MFSTDCAKSFGLMTKRNMLMACPSSCKMASSWRNVHFKHVRNPNMLLTVATFLVVSFWDLEMSSSFNSCGFRSSSLFFSSFARLTGARFFCSIDRGPSLHRISGRVYAKVYNTHMNPIAGTLRLLASALRPIFSQFKGASPSLPSSISEPSTGWSSRDFRPPINVTNFDTNSSRSKAPEPDFMARAFCAPILEAIKRKWESSVASWGPFTKGMINLHRRREPKTRTFVEELIGLMYLVRKFFGRIIIWIGLLLYV